MNKVIINILVFLVVLSVPFAISSQTRKAIPAGRYEALSGIKVSHSTKTEISSQSSAETSIWQEVSKNLPADKNEIYYFKKSNLEFNFATLFPNKNFREVKKADQGFDLLITDNIKNDKDSLKHLHSKGLVVVMSNIGLKEMISGLPNFELVVFQSAASSFNYLFKSK